MEQDETGAVSPARVRRRRTDQSSRGRGRTSPGGSGRSRRRRRTGRDAAEQPVRSRRRRRVLAGLGGLALVLLGCGVWLGLTAHSAQGDLVAARDELEQAKVALLSGDNVTATARIASASDHALEARSATHGVVWDVVAAVPGAGRPAATVQGITEAVDDLATEVLAPTVRAGNVLALDRLRPSGRQVDLTALVSAQEPLASASAAADRLRDRAQRIPSALYLGPVDDARDELVTQVADLAGLLDNADTAARLMPSMLGGSGVRHYFIAFQTNAESRGTGGLVGAYGLLTADRGTLSLDTLSSNVELLNNVGTGIDLGPDFEQAYGDYGSTRAWYNSNISANFSYAARIWASLWEQQSGQRIDGAIATDPVALSYVLGATGPITLADGQVVDGDNTVALTESELYSRFDDTFERKDYLQTIGETVVDTITTGAGGSTSALLSAMGRAAGEGRLAVWSSVPEEQQVLAGTPLGRVVPETAAPYANLVVNNAAGGKLDYYLGRTLAWTAGDCSGATRGSTVTASLTNGAPAEGLAPYVLTRADADPQGPSGTNRLLVSLYATAGAQLRSVTVDGVAATVTVDAELGHPVYTLDLQIPPGATSVITYSLVEPSSAGAPQVPVQPLVRPMETTVDVPTCGS